MDIRSASATLLIFLATSVASSVGAEPPRPALHVPLDDHVYLPEYLYSDGSDEVCLRRVDLLSPDMRARKSLFFQFVKSRSIETQEWTRKYTLLGTDFSDFRYFYLAAPGRCQISQIPVDAGLKAFLKKAQFEERIITNSPLLAERSKMPNMLVGTAAFTHFRPRSDIAQCLIRVRSSDPHDVGFSSRWAASIVGIWHKYRPPIIDFGGANSEMYILLSRQCSTKVRIVESVLELAGYPVSGQAFVIDASPDPELYLHNFANGAPIPPSIGNP